MSSPRDDAKSEDGDTLAQAKGVDDAPSSPVKPEVCHQPRRKEMFCAHNQMSIKIPSRCCLSMANIEGGLCGFASLSPWVASQSINGSNRRVSAHQLGNSWGTRKHT